MIAIASPNIAFIKYWGKLEARQDEDRNLATNPSLSMTLSRARTETCVRPGRGPTRLWLNGAPASETDTAKVRDHLARVSRHFGLPEQDFEVESRNNFPAGAGIASSASAFAALTLAAAGELLGENQARRFLKQNLDAASELARRGSGSACRSVAGPFMKWDGRAARALNPSWHLRDTILILSRQHKAVPSTDGHRLAQSSPHFDARLARVPERLARVESALLERDLSRLGPVLEEEALELHAIAGTSRPPVDYLLPETRRLLAHIGALKQRDFYFTLDAGPNLHLISEHSLKSELEPMLARLGIEAEIWEDEAGSGPELRPGHHL